MDPHRSPCPIASTLDILGDRWSLVIVRDLLTGKRLFGDFLDSAEGISTNILADRLKRLAAAGLVARTAYLTRPRRYAYSLTEDGKALLPVLQEICIWGNKTLPGTWVPPAFWKRPQEMAPVSPTAPTVGSSLRTSPAGPWKYS